MEIKLKILLIAISLAGILSVFNYSNSNAVSYDAPDIVGAGTTFDVEHTPSTPNADKINIPVYYAKKPTSPITVTVYQVTKGGTYSRGVRINDSSFIVWSGQAKSFDIPASSFVLDSLYGLYRANVKASLAVDSGGGGGVFNNSNWVHFRMRLSDTSGLIGIGGANTNINIAHKDFAATSPAYTYQIPMATPCGITNNETKRIYLQDLDSGNGDNGYQQIVVRFTDETSGTTQTWYGNSTAGMGQNGNFNFGWLFQPNHKYKLTIAGSVPSNVIKMRLPYDNVNYNSKCFNYSLDPYIDNSVMGNIAQVQGTINVPSYIVKTGPNNTQASNSDNTNWELSRLIVNPSTSVPNGVSATNNDVAPGSFLSGPGVVYSKEASGSGIFTASRTDLATYTMTTPDLPVGTKICFVLSVQPRSFDSQQWRHSQAQCVTIAKAPKVQIWGGDLTAGRYFIGQTPSGASSNVIASVSLKSVAGEQRAFGSWVEYGIFSTGSITGAASKSAFSGPSGLLMGDPSNACVYSQLSFTNVDPNSATCNNIGNYNLSGSIPDVGSSFSVNSSTSRLNVAPASNDITNLSGVYTADGDVNIISTGDISKGRLVVINAPGRTVTINSDIAYTSGILDRISDIPQVLIIAKDILIAGNVTRIDAWLVASGKINTCSSVSDSASLSISICSQPLIVNGPVMANQLFLRRTAGSGTGASSGDPAEVFNLRADAYLWAAARSMNLGRAQTVYNSELPPRF